MRPNRGFTILEVVIALAIFLVVSAVTIKMLSLTYQSQQKNNLYEKAVVLMKESHFEVEGKSLAQLPAANRCYVRDYDLTGQLINEGEHAVGSSACNLDNASESSIRIVSEFYNLQFSDFTYTHPQFLKKPTDPDAIKEVRIMGRVYDRQIDSRLYLTVFKR